MVRQSQRRQVVVVVVGAGVAGLSVTAALAAAGFDVASSMSGTLYLLYWVEGSTH